MGWYWRDGGLIICLRKVVMTGDELEHTWKGSGTDKAREGCAVFSEEDCELFLCLLMKCVFFKELDTE